MKSKKTKQRNNLSLQKELKRKIKNTPLEKYVKIVGEVVENNQEKILEKFEI